MKKVQAFKCFCLIASLSMTPVYAEFEMSGSDGISGQGTASDGTIVVDSNSQGDTEIAYNVPSTSCEKADQYAPYRLIQKLMIKPSDFKVEMVKNEDSDDRTTSKLQVKVTLPPFYNACLEDLKFVPVKAKNQTLHVRMKMGKTYEEYLTCLKGKTEGGKPLFDGGKYDKSHPQATISSVQHMLFDIDVDPGKNVDVYFDSPTPTPKNGSHRFVNGEPKDIVSCFKSEDFKKDGYVLYKSPETTAAERAYEACSNGDHREILNELERLRSAGNANQLLRNAGKLERILNNALEEARGARVEAIFKEMEDTANEFKEFKKEGFKEEDEELVKESAKKYVKLIEELDEISIHPSIKMVEALLDARKKTGITAEEREVIDEEIKRLNGVIGQFDTKNRTQMKVIFEGLKEYSLVDQAYTIEGFRLKSDLYNKVHKDRRTGDRERKPMMTLDSAAAKIKSNLRKFETRTTDWEDAYLAKRGYNEPIGRTQKQYEFALSRFKKDEQTFKRNEAKLYKKYCQPSFVMFNQQYHQRRCQKHQQGSQARMQKYLKIRENQLGYIASRKGKFDELNGWYSAAIQRQAAEYGDDNDPYGFYTYNPGGEMDYGSDFSMGLPTTPNYGGAGRQPAQQGGGVPGYPIMGPMAGQNPYAVPYGQTPGFVPQPGYFSGGYRGY
ncbi:MAG: hypothetical protein ACJAT2_003522 [Bacteriovoracaceae bacterium]|jgi:hypothetical protein